MSKGDYFVILNHPNCGFVHMSEGDENDLARFETEDDARNAAKANALGGTFGYEIFEAGTGNS